MTETVSIYVKRTRHVSSNTPKTEDVIQVITQNLKWLTQTKILQKSKQVRIAKYSFRQNETNTLHINSQNANINNILTKTIHYIIQTTKNSSRGLTTWLSETQYSHRLPLSCRVHSSEWNNYLRKSLLNSVKCYSKTYFGATYLKQCE